MLDQQENGLAVKEIRKSTTPYDLSPLYKNDGFTSVRAFDTGSSWRVVKAIGDRREVNVITKDGHFVSADEEDTARARYNSLSSRMKTIIEISLRGEGRKEQARYFNRAIKTIRNTVTTVFKQLDCKDNIDLYRFLFAINVTSSDTVFDNFHTTKQEFVGKLKTLTPRQTELLSLIPLVHGRGALIDSLSVVVGTSYHTVHKQFSDMLRRLDVNRVEDAYLLYLASLQGEEHGE